MGTVGSLFAGGWCIILRTLECALSCVINVEGICAAARAIRPNAPACPPSSSWPPRRRLRDHRPCWLGASTSPPRTYNIVFRNIQRARPGRTSSRPEQMPHTRLKNKNKKTGHEHSAAVYFVRRGGCRWVGSPEARCGSHAMPHGQLGKLVLLQKGNRGFLATMLFAVLRENTMRGS